MKFEQNFQQHARRFREIIGYDGPARAEPFYPPLSKMSPDAGCETVMASLRNAAALLK